MMFEKRKIFEGVANVTKGTLNNLSRHKLAKREPMKHGGTYFVKSLGSLKQKIIFRFFVEDNLGDVSTCEEGAFTGPCFVIMMRRVHPNGQVYYTVDLTHQPEEITDMFIEVIEGDSEYRSSATSEVVEGLDITGHMSVQIIQR